MDILAAATSTAPAAPAGSGAPTAVERIEQIPMEFWVRLGIGVFGLIALVLILRKVAKINKVVLAIGTVIVVSSVGFYCLKQGSGCDFYQVLESFVSPRKVGLTAR